MERIILISFLFLITTIYVYQQKLVMNLSNKIWHFVPLLFFGILTIYGYLRSSRMIVYYSDYNNDWTIGVTEFITGIHGFLTSLITLIIIYLYRRKRPTTSVRKIRKGFAVAVSVFLLVFTGFNVYEIASYDYSQNTVDFRSQKLTTISEYMFDRLHEGDFDNNTSFKKKELLEYIGTNSNSDVYIAVLYSDFSSICFLDEHTVMISNGTIFQSDSGYLITDGQRNYPNGFLKLPGSGYDGEGIDVHGGKDNIYSWRAGL